MAASPRPLRDGGAVQHQLLLLALRSPAQYEAHAPKVQFWPQRHLGVLHLSLLHLRSHEPARGTVHVRSLLSKALLLHHSQAPLVERKVRRRQSHECARART